MVRAIGILAASVAAWPAPAADDRPSSDTSPASDSGEVPTIAVPEEAGAPPANAPAALDRIVVTATKRREWLRDLPASVGALSGRQLEDMGAATIEDFLDAIPGAAHTQFQPDLYRFTIRGMQTDASNVTPQTAGIFIDDMPVNDPFLTQVTPDLPPFDLEGIEVLKGPQGTLFGGSGLAGALRYKLADAIPGVTELRSFVFYQTVADGSPGRGGGAAANLPFAGSDAALRLVAVRRLAGGTIDDRRNGESDTDEHANVSGRALVRWIPDDRLSLGLRALTHQTEAADVPLAETTDGRLERERALRKSPSVTEFGFYGVDVKYRTDWADLVSVTNAVHKRGDLAIAYAERILNAEDGGQGVDAPTTADVDGVVQEFRLVSPDDEAGPWRWLVGAFGYDYASLSTQRIVGKDARTGQDSVLLDFLADVSATEYALFGEVSRALGDAWRAGLGLRAYRVATEGTVTSSGAIILATGSAENRNDASIEASGVNPRLALQYDVSEGIAVYGNAARGFRFGGIQIIGPSPASPDVPTTYSSDTVWSYEVGVRTEWLDRLLWADGAVFYVDWQDPQVRTTTGGAVPLNVIDNVGAARSRGAELAVRYLTPIDGLRLDLAGAYTDARTTEPFTAPNGQTVPAGSRLPGAPDWQATGLIACWRALGPVRFEGALSHVFQGKGVSDILQSLNTYDYQSTDLRLAVGTEALALSPKLTFSAFNLTDERAVVSAFVESADNFTTVYMRPRTLELRLDLAF